MRAVFSRAEPGDIGEISSLADRVFRSHRPGHMAEEFPHLYHPDNAAHWFIAREAGSIVAIVGAVVGPVALSGALTRAACLGSVATVLEFRGQGLASQLLGFAQAALREESVRLITISGDQELYRRFGARPVGRIDWVALPADLGPPWRYRTSPIDPDHDAATVARLYQSRPTRFIRDLELLKVLLRSQPMTGVEQGEKIARLVSDDTGPVCYFILNHRPFGGRRASRLSEWGGDPQALLAGLAQVSSPSETLIEIPLEADDWALRGALRGAAFMRCGPAAWLQKIIDGPGLLGDLALLWGERSGKSPRLVADTDDRFQLWFGPHRWAVDMATLTEWVFGMTAPPELECLWPIPALWPEGLNYV